MIEAHPGPTATLIASAALMLAALFSGCAAGAAPAADPDARRALAAQDIALLQRRYGQATDLISLQNPDTSRTGAIYRHLFTDNAEIGLQDQPRVVGPDAWLAFVAASQRTLTGSQHLIGSQVVDVSELPDQRGLGGKATMTSYLLATQVAADGAIIRISGTYRAEAVHTPDIGWQLSKMTLSLLAVEGAD